MTGIAYRCPKHLWTLLTRGMTGCSVHPCYMQHAVDFSAFALAQRVRVLQCVCAVTLTSFKCLKGLGEFFFVLGFHQGRGMTTRVELPFQGQAMVASLGRHFL